MTASSSTSRRPHRCRRCRLGRRLRRIGAVYRRLARQSLRYVSRDPKGPGEIAVRLRSPGGRWLPRWRPSFCAMPVTAMWCAIHDPQPGLWTVEVATDRQRHTPYTVGGFVRSPLTLQLDVPTLVGVGGVIGVKTSVGDRRGGIYGVKVRTTVAAPSTSADLIDKYRDRLSRIKLPRDFLADGKPDKARAHSLSSFCCEMSCWPARGTTFSRRGSTTSRSARLRSSPRVWPGSADAGRVCRRA